MEEDKSKQNQNLNNDKEWSDTSFKEPIEEKTPEPEVKEVKEIHHHHYKERGSHFGKIFLGIVIIGAGLYFLAVNMGVVPENWKFDIWQLWPLLIIFIGLSIISGRGWVSAIIGVVITILIIGFVVSLIYGNLPGYGATSKVTPINIAKESGITSAVVNLKDGAGNIVVSGETDNLVQGTLATNVMELEKKSEVSNGKQTVDLKITSPWNRSWWHRTNDLDIELSSQTPLKFNVDSGAADLKLDLSKVMAEEVNINTGASSLNLTMGDKLSKAKLDINAGASSVKISLPNTVGATIRITSGISSRDLENFDQLDEKNYQSIDYEKKDKKIELVLDLGASGITVDWYDPAQKEAVKSEVKWEAALNSIKSCNVKAVNQNRNLSVTLILKNDQEIKTTEPAIDTVIQEIRKIESTCGQVTISTE